MGKRRCAFDGNDAQKPLKGVGKGVETSNWGSWGVACVRGHVGDGILGEAGVVVLALRRIRPDSGADWRGLVVPGTDGRTPRRSLQLNFSAASMRGWY